MTRYNRDQIGLRAPEAVYDLTLARVQGIALHWPGTKIRVTTPAAAMAALRTYQRMHMDTNGWSDIAYQEAVDQAGNSYLLRGLRHRSGANGNTDLNERFGAILLLLAEGEEPTKAMIATTRRRIARHHHLFQRSSIITGHGMIRPGGTQCPGPAATRLILAGAFTPQEKKK